MAHDPKEFPLPPNIRKTTAATIIRCTGLMLPMTTFSSRIKGLFRRTRGREAEPASSVAQRGGCAVALSSRLAAFVAKDQQRCAARTAQSRQGQAEASGIGADDQTRSMRLHGIDGQGGLVTRLCDAPGAIHAQQDHVKRRQRTESVIRGEGGCLTVRGRRPKRKEANAPRLR